MARRTTRSGSRSSGSRQSKATSKKAATTDVEVIEEAEDGNIDSAIVMLTSVCLLAALLCTDKLLAMYGKGMFM